MWYIPSAPRVNYSLLVMESAGMMKMAIGGSGRYLLTKSNGPALLPEWATFGPSHMLMYHRRALSIHWTPSVPMQS